MCVTCSDGPLVLILNDWTILLLYLGTNEQAIVHICSTRDNAQRQKLKKMFKTAFGKVRNIDRAVDTL